MENTVISAQEALNMTLQCKNREWPCVLEHINQAIQEAANGGNISCKVSVKNIFENDIFDFLTKQGYSVWFEDSYDITRTMFIRWGH